MKKKTTKKKKPKQKIDVVLDKIANLEKQISDLVKKVEHLQYSQPYYAPQPNEPNQPWKPTWPNHPPIVWENTSTMGKKDSNWEAIENGWQ
jgi:hypothetical protein